MSHDVHVPTAGELHHRRHPAQTRSYNECGISQQSRGVLRERVVDEVGTFAQTQSRQPENIPHSNGDVLRINPA